MSRRQTQDFLKCCICIGTVCRPRIIPCGHSFCEACLKDYMERRASERRRLVGTEVTCPVCRMTIEPPGKDIPVEDWATAFPLNHLVISLLDERADAKDELSCSSHPEKPGQFFCQDHLDILCSQCLFDSHRNCPIKDTHEISVGAMKATTEHQIDTIQHKSKQHIDSLTEGIDKVCSESEAIVIQVESFQAEIDQKMKELVKKVKYLVNGERKETVKTLHDKRETYRKHLQNLKQMTSRLEENDRGERLVGLVNVLIDYRHCFNEIKTDADKAEDDTKPPMSWNRQEKSEEIVNAFEKLIRETSVGFDFVEQSEASDDSCPGDDNTQDIGTDTAIDSGAKVTECQGAGEIEASVEVVLDDTEFTTSRDSSMTYVKEQPLWFRKADYLDKVTIDKRKNDLYDCDISACAVSKDGRIFLIDHNNNKLRILSKNASSIYKQTKEWVFKGRPWGVTVLPSRTSKLAITFPFSRVVTTLDVDDTHFAARKIPTKEKCYGIAAIGSGFVITTYDDGSFVIFMNNEGEETIRVALSETGNPNTMNPISVTVPEYFNAGEVYIGCQSDRRNNGCVVAIDTHGAILRKYEGAGIQGCDGCDLDADGNVYVCGYNSSTVHVFASNGVAPKVILSSDDTINKPCQIRFLSPGNMFLIAEQQSIKLYLLVPL